jgi:indole-3-acetate monooxygenase
MSLIDAARTLAPTLAARASDTEAARRLPPDLAHAISDAGLFRMFVPHAYGGPQTDPATFVEVVETVARADAAPAWCVMIAATTAMTAAYMEPEDAKAIHGRPEGISGGVFAPMGRAVRDGDAWRVNGRWQWASGSQNCDWLLGGCLLEDDGHIRMLPGGAPDARMLFWPAGEAELIDTWHVTGLKGTGSLDMAVKDVRVPLSRMVSLVADKPRIEAPLYAFPAFGLLSFGIAAVALGNARAAIDDLVALAGGKKPQGARKVLAERAMAQVELAKAEAALRSARAFLFDEIGAAWAIACKGDPVPRENRALLRLAATNAVRTGAEVVRAMYDLAGGTAVYETSPLQRRFRDAHVATQHMMTAPATYELTGRVFMGLPGDDAML